MSRNNLLKKAIISVLLLLPLTVAAQETTPDPQAAERAVEFVYNWEARLAYPSGALLVVVVDRPASDVATIQLTITVDGETSDTLTFASDELVSFSNAFTVYQYAWLEPTQRVIPVFSTITYQWRVVLRDGEAVTVEDSFQFTDPRIIWERQTDPQNRLDLWMPEGGAEVSLDEAGEIVVELTAMQIHDTLSPTLDLLEEQTNSELQRTVALFYTDRRPLNPCIDPDLPPLPIDERTGEILPCDASLLAESFAAAGIIPLEAELANITSVQLPLIDVLVREAYNPLWVSADVPAWFVFGLSEFYKPTGKTPYQETVRTAQRLNRLFSMARMNNPDDIADTDLWQAQSYSMVLYIAQQHGVDAVFELAREVSGTEPFAETYERITGDTLDTLLPNLQNWVFTSGSVQDFQYIPYLQTTPSPTPSISPTPFPPTATPTATATVTETPTPTVTGFLTATPLPTLTATDTPIATQPPNTPRPAGSLREPTAIPDSNNNSDGQNTLSLMIGIGAISLAVVILAITFLPRRNQR